MIKAVIFDCYGVIRPDRFMQAYRDFGGDPEADKEFLASAFRAAHTGAIASSRDLVAERLGIATDVWMHALDHEAHLDAELLDYIEQLHKQYKTAVLSNASIGTLKALIGEEDAKRCFDTMVESGQLGFAKPDVEIYEYAADRLGVRYDECVFTDDREEYCEGARSAGMQAILYQSFEQFKRDLEKLL